MKVPDCLAYDETEEREQSAGLVAPVRYAMYRHDKTPGSFYASRAICIKAMIKVGASKLYRSFGNEWVEDTMMSYEKEAIRKAKMLRWKK